MDTPELLVVGRIHRVHGLKGEVSVEIRTAFPDRLRPGMTLLWQRDAEAPRSLVLAGARPHGRRMLLSFEGVADSDSAHSLCGADLCVPAGESVPAPEGFFYSHEIQGFACVDADGSPLATAVGVEETPAGPLLAVSLPSGKEALVPFVEEYVLKIDRDTRTIVLDLPAGLLDL